MKKFIRKVLVHIMRFFGAPYPDCYISTKEYSGPLIGYCNDVGCEQRTKCKRFYLQLYRRD